MKKKIHLFVFMLGCIVLSGLILMACGKTSYLEKTEKAKEIDCSYDEPSAEQSTEQRAEQSTEQSTEQSREQKEEKSSSESVTKDWIVQVSGAVKEPGVYQMKEGSRLYEAIQLAGGLLPNAYDRNLNQAERLSDGQRVYVLTREEVDELVSRGQKPEDLAVLAAGDISGTGTEGVSGKSSDGLVNINTAGPEELMTLSGIGSSKASSIISYREENGPFEHPEDIMQIPGIKQGAYNKIKDQIKVR